MRSTIGIAVIAGALLAGLAACGYTHAMNAPKGFVAYEDTEGLKLITPDGVRLRSREVDNYPEGDLDFWVDALERHLDKRGYVKKDKRCFDTAAGLKGCTIDVFAPGQTEDWFFSETVFVKGDRIVLVEAAGPGHRYNEVGPAIDAALKTFVPSD